MKKGVVLIAAGLMSLTVTGSALAGSMGRFPRAARPPQQQRSFPRQSPVDSEDSREKEHVDRGDHAERGEHADKNAASAPQTPQAQHAEAPRNAEPNREGMRPPEAPQGGAQQMPAGRAGARMSLEERQKLRRQINEAGRSLYTPPSPTGNK